MREAGLSSKRQDMQGEDTTMFILGGKEDFQQGGEWGVVVKPFSI